MKSFFDALAASRDRHRWYLNKYSGVLRTAMTNLCPLEAVYKDMGLPDGLLTVIQKGRIMGLMDFTIYEIIAASDAATWVGRYNEGVRMRLLKAVGLTEGAMYVD